MNQIPHQVWGTYADHRRCFQPISRLVIRFHIGDLHLHLDDRCLVTRSSHSVSLEGLLFDMRW